MNPSYLVFKLRDLNYGIEVSHVREIFALPELMPAPEAPGDIIGLLNLRGKILPIMHLDRRLGQALRPCCLSDRVIVVEWRGLQVGVVVNQVEEVCTLDATAIDIDVSYGREHTISTAFLQGVAKGESDLPLLLLNPDTLLRRAEDVAMLAWEAELDHLTHAAAVIDFNPRLLTPNAFYELYCPEASGSERAIFRERAEVLRRSPENAEAEDLLAIAVVKVEGEYFGISLDTVREFITVPKVSPIPCCPDHIVGNTNLRGEVVLLLDIRSTLNLSKAAKRPISKAVILQVGDIVAGITVDEVCDILFLHTSELAPLPAALQGSAAFRNGTYQYRETLLSVLNVPNVLSAQQGRVPM